MAKETLQAFYERLLINNIDYNALKAASTILWGIIAGNITEVEGEIIINAADAVDKVLEIFNSKT